MFGQQQNTTSPFGSPPATSPFGAPQQQQQSAFGSAPAPAFGGAGGAFGAPQQQSAFGQQQSTFGGTTNTFGTTPAAPAPSGFGTFGSTATSTSSSPFGAPAPSGGGLFGNAPTPATGSLFGGGGATSSTTPAFGTTTTQPSAFGSGGGGAFGSTTSTSTTFGAPSQPAFGSTTGQTTSIFGSNAPAPSPFGTTPAPAPLFGASPAAAPTGSVFGGSPSGMGGFGQQQQQQQGTAAVPFQPTTRTDGTSSTNIVFQSITAMPQYEASGKSFEELRFEDYSQGNRGTGTQASSASGAFGTTTSTPAFGSTPAPSGGGLFGATPAPAAFGSTFGAAPAPAPSTGLFGSTPAPAPAFGSTFGAPTQAPATGSLFGSSTPAPAPAFGAFGTSPAPAPSGGLFGSAPAPAPGAFGSAPAPAPGGLFGSTTTPAPAPFGGFGAAPAPAPSTGLFGSAPAPAPSTGLFGSAPAPAPTGGLFGSAPAPAPGGLFGSTPAPAPAFGAFGAPAPAPSAFGPPAPAPGGLFGASAPAPGGFFGSAPAPAPGGLFGAPAAAPPAAAQPFMPPNASIIPPATDAVLQQQLQAIENSRKELEQMEVWRGGSPNTSVVIPASNPDSQGLRVSPYSPSVGSAVPYRASPRSAAKIRPRGFDTPTLPSSQKTPMSFMSPDTYVASATKRLVIKSTTPKPTMRLRLRDIAAEESKEEIRDDVILTLPNVTVSPPAPTNVASPVETMGTPVGVTSPPAAAAAAPNSATMRESTPTSTNGQDFYKRVVASAGSSSKKKPATAKDDLTPKLTMADYTVSPSLEEMASMSEAELATVSGFTVTRSGVGSVSWDGSVDVRGVDLDEVISIQPRDVAVYDEAESNGTKPSVGDKLNRSAVITMFDIFPKQSSDAAAIAKFERKIEKTTKNMDAELISYDSSSGVWKFRVPHFSRYALVDDSDDEDEEMEVFAKPAQHFEGGERGGRSPKQDEAIPVDEENGTSWFGAFRTQDEAVTEVMWKENDESANNLARAELAFKSMATSVAEDRARQTRQKSILKKQKKIEQQQEEASALFPDEGVVLEEDDDDLPARPSEKEQATMCGLGVCASIARKCGVQSFSASNIDYGMRMGRSFRVGWRPDGSFLNLKPGSAVVLEQSRPILTDETTALDDNEKLLEAHLINSEKVSSPTRECPYFRLSPTSNLRKALSEYVKACAPSVEGNNSDPEEGLVLMRAFSLLLSLFVKDDSTEGSDTDVPMIEGADESKARLAVTEKKRIDACVEWLLEACAEDVQNDIRDAMEKNDVHSAIFAAATGGDIEQASSIAMSHGYLHLASLLAAGASSFYLIGQQVEQWNISGASQTIPSNLFRLYTILGGDLNAEEQLNAVSVESGQQSNLDWRRRLCMLLTFGVQPEDEANLPSLMKTYERQISETKAPYPSPRYIWNEEIANDGGPRSLLYKILGLTKTTEESDNEVVSLANVVSPSGYTRAITDYSGAFHVAAAISALSIGASLSPKEQALVLDSYASQLINSGRWDLAVYVMLCSFGTDHPEDLVSRERNAKDILLQNCPDVTMGKVIPKRAELEGIGVPSAWFEEALAYRCGNKGDTLQYIMHLNSFSPKETKNALEELVVPNLFCLRSKDELQRSLALLEPFSWDDDSLISTVLDFFKLADSIVAVSLSDLDQDKKEEEIHSLSEMAASIKSRLQAHRTFNDEIQDAPSSHRVTPSYRLVPTLAFLAEALTRVKFLQLQLGALAAGSSIWDEAYLRGKSSRPLKVASELALISARNATASTSDETGGDASVVGSPITLTGL